MTSPQYLAIRVVVESAKHGDLSNNSLSGAGGGAEQHVVVSVV